MKYQAICFDIDGTLYPASFLKRVGLNMALKHPFLALEYKKYRAEIRRIQDGDDKAFNSLSFNDKEGFVFGKQKGWEPDKAKKYLEDTYYRYLRKEYSGLRDFQGSAMTFEKIRSKGLKIGVFSDWPLFDKLKQLGLEKMCDVMSSPYTSGYLKPSVHAFDEMLYNLKVEPKYVLYVGDSYNKDVLGAVGAGMDAVLIKPDCKNVSDYPKALKVVRDWKEFDLFLDSVLEEE